MSETENIAKMAEILSTELFNIFLWEKEGPININWNCQISEHCKHTHPTDVVFTYKEPYCSKRTYLNCDLKSYAKESINAEKLRTALKSLAQTIECANMNTDWETKYKNYDDNYVVNGLLFIYNHDGEYDKKFDDLLHTIKTDEILIPKGRKIFVLGPKDICFLQSVANDIDVLRGRKKMPDKENCSFFFPDLIEKRANSIVNMPAKIEMLTSPYIAIKYKSDKTTGLRLYYRRSGSSVDEFLYLFDYLFHYQQLQNCEEIYLSLYDPATDAAVLFETAKTRYADKRDNNEEIKTILNKVRYQSLTTIIKKFSTVEIGMDYAKD